MWLVDRLVHGDTRKFNPFVPRQRQPHKRPLVFHDLSKKELSQLFRRRRLVTAHFAIPVSQAPESSFWSVSHMLREKLVRCPALKVGKPVGNSSALSRTFKEATRRRQMWTHHHPPALGHTFISSLYENESSRITYTPQIRKLLESEGDVGDALTINVLLPAVLLLNKLIAPQYREFFFVAIQHQTSYTSDTSESIFIDHSIVLLDRRGFSSKASKRNAKRDRVYLLIVEEKKAGYVRPQGWDTSFDEENVTSLVPQGLMYAHLYDCRRVLFSDYENGVALYIEEDKSQEEELAFTVASHECHGPRGGPNVDTAAVLNDPVNLGLRSTTAFLGVCALNELGVLDYGQVPFPAKHQISSLDARLEAIRILEPPGPEPQPEAAPTLKTFKFHHPPPPNERPKRATRGSGRSG